MNRQFVAAIELISQRIKYVESALPETKDRIAISPVKCPLTIVESRRSDSTMSTFPRNSDRFRRQLDNLTAPIAGDVYSIATGGESKTTYENLDSQDRFPARRNSGCAFRILY